MTKRDEAQCFNDGRLAFRERVAIDRCPRRGSLQRAAWLRGFEHEKRRGTAEQSTPEKLAESAKVIARLKDFANTL